MAGLSVFTYIRVAIATALVVLTAVLDVSLDRIGEVGHCGPTQLISHFLTRDPRVLLTFGLALLGYEVTVFWEHAVSCRQLSETAQVALMRPRMLLDGLLAGLMVIGFSFPLDCAVKHGPYLHNLAVTAAFINRMLVIQIDLAAAARAQGAGLPVALIPLLVVGSLYSCFVAQGGISRDERGSYATFILECVLILCCFALDNYASHLRVNLVWARPGPDFICVVKTDQLIELDCRQELSQTNTGSVNSIMIQEHQLGALLRESSLGTSARPTPSVIYRRHQTVGGGDPKLLPHRCMFTSTGPCYPCGFSPRASDSFVLEIWMSPEREDDYLSYLQSDVPIPDGLHKARPLSQVDGAEMVNIAELIDVQVEPANSAGNPIFLSPRHRDSSPLLSPRKTRQPLSPNSLKASTSAPNLGSLQLSAPVIETGELGLDPILSAVIAADMESKLSGSQVDVIRLQHIESKELQALGKFTGLWMQTLMALVICFSPCGLIFLHDNW